MGKKRDPIGRFEKESGRHLTVNLINWCECLEFTPVEERDVFAPGGVKHILVVDDDPAVSSYLKDALSTLGHSVDTCASAKEALLRLQQRTYQLVITDLCMPGLSGREVLKFVRAGCRKSRWSC